MRTVCLLANSLTYPQGGGHLWAYLNWALGLRAAGCEVVWLEAADPQTPEAERRGLVEALKANLKPYGLSETVALCSLTDQPLPPSRLAGWLELDAAREAELLVNLAYDIRPEIVGSFRRSILVDIDPGLLQVWVSQGTMRLAPHDFYFSIGERIGQSQTCFPNLGLEWVHTPPPVALDWWRMQPAAAGAPFTTVSHWGAEWQEDATGSYSNSKRDGFLPFLDLPRQTTQRLELALCLGDDQPEVQAWEKHGWRVRDAFAVAATPWEYQAYIQNSRGEFSCAKPSCVRYQNAWISDRTICYLASGKPAVVQHTGPSEILPEAAGLFRFHDLPQAAHFLQLVAADYERQCRLARALAEEHFDAQKVVGRVLERGLN